MEQERVAPTDEADAIPDRLLRSALELAVGIAAAGAKSRPAVPPPDGLRPFLRLHRLPPAAYAKVRRTIEADPAFRARVGEAATSELVDEIGLHWLRRDDGWQATIAELLDAGDPSNGERAAVARREQRKRQAAEEAAAKARADISAMQEQLARERAAREREQADLQRATDALAAAQRRIDELERAAAKLRASVSRVEELHAAADAARHAAEARAGAAEAARDAVLAARVEALSGPPPPFDTGAVRRMHERAVQGVHDAERAMRELGRLLAEARRPPPAPVERPGRPRRERARRSPLPIPGGLYGDSAAVAEHLLRVPGVLVLVDGYNVAKLGWPTLELVDQRERCVAVAEDVARRWGTAITIVFDGADVVGASGARRLVRVIFSPAGVIADDVLRAEVEAADVAQPLVVVSNDQAVIADVRAEGANTLGSDQFLAVARR